MNLIVRGDEGLMPLVGDLTQQRLVLAHSRLNRRYQMPRFQIFHATGGFGCQANSLGSAVYGIHIADGESARWNRNDFIGIADDELVSKALEDTTPVENIDLDKRTYFLVAKDGSVETGDTPELARRRLGRITNAKVKVAYHAHPESQVNGFGLISYPKGAEPVEVKIKSRGGIWIDAN